MIQYKATAENNNGIIRYAISDDPFSARDKLEKEMRKRGRNNYNLVLRTVFTDKKR